MRFNTADGLTVATAGVFTSQKGTGWGVVCFVIFVHSMSHFLNKILPNFCCNLELFSGIKGFEENFFLFFWLNKIKFE